MASEVDRVELMVAIQNAVNTKIAAWDAEHDIENVFGGDDIDALPDIINSVSVSASADMTDERLEEIANEIIEAHAEQYEDEQRTE